MGLASIIEDALTAVIDALPLGGDVYAEEEQSGEEKPKEDGEGESEEKEEEGGEEEAKEEEPEEEEEEEDEPVDTKPQLEEECANSAQCRPAKQHYDHCVERVHEAEEKGDAHKGPKEDCVEEFFHLAHCATNCAAPKLFAQLK